MSDELKSRVILSDYAKSQAVIALIDLDEADKVIGWGFFEVMTKRELFLLKVVIFAAIPALGVVCLFVRGVL